VINGFEASRTARSNVFPSTRLLEFQFLVCRGVVRWFVSVVYFECGVFRDGRRFLKKRMFNSPKTEIERFIIPAGSRP